MRYRAIHLSALLLCVSGCQAATEPDDGLPVEFVYGVHRIHTEPAFVVAVTADAVRVRGSLRTPCQPYAASASAEPTGRTLVLRVIGEAKGECPLDPVVSVGYQATVRTAPAEYDRLHVIHEWRDANWPAETVVSEEMPSRTGSTQP